MHLPTQSWVEGYSHIQADLALEARENDQDTCSVCYSVCFSRFFSLIGYYKISSIVPYVIY